MRTSTEASAYRVRVTHSYVVECPCRHYERQKRPCGHSVPAIKAASTLADAPHYQNMPDCSDSVTLGTAELVERSTLGLLSIYLLGRRADQVNQEDSIARESSQQEVGTDGDITDKAENVRRM